MLKRLLSFFCLCSIGCTCLVMDTLAQAAGNEAPCHHMAMEMGANEQPTENCCQEKMEAWNEAVEQEKNDTPSEVQAIITTPHWEETVLPTTLKNTWARPPDRNPPAHIYSWNTVRLII